MVIRERHLLYVNNSNCARRLACFVLWLAFLSLRIPTAYGFNLQNVQHLVVFGDSLSDNGNSLAAAGRPKPPYYYGRWTNGLNWVDFFSYYSRVNQHFLPVTAFLQNRGTNFAVAGSDSLALTGQIGSYLGDVGGRASPNDLFVIWIGANDFSQDISAKITVSSIEAGIVALWKAGARNFVVINLPDISLTPDVKNEGTKTDLAARQFVYTVNTSLQAQIPFYSSFLGVTILLIDVNTPFTQLVNTRTWTVKGLGTVNFVNSSGFAYNPNNGALASNPNSFVFWDGFHPTATVHYLAGWFIFQSVFPGTSSIPVAK